MHRVTLSLLALVALAACGDSSTTASTNTTLAPSSVNALSGNGQSGTAGSALAQSLVVQVSNAAGAPVAGVTVAFSVASGTATLSPSSAVTDASGQASTQVTLGAAGTVVISAAVQGSTGSTVNTAFTLTAIAAVAATPGAPGVPSANCTPTSLASGGAVVVSGSSICVDGGSAGAEYAVIPFNGSTTQGSTATVSLQASGVTAVTSALADASVSGASTLNALGASASVSPRDAFERRLRANARAVLAPKLSAARRWYRARNTTANGLRLDAIPATASVGSVVSLNANADDPCAKARFRGARVMAVGSKALVVADTLNPTGGYTQADYASIAATFDTLVDAVDTKNFGQPTDIDGNGHVILFFTSAVNALTPKNADYYIGGFFYERDLFPTTATAQAEACASSNVAEMFYLMVPDPSGTINGNAFSKSFVTSAAIATTAHEYQHLINASRRMYVNPNSTDFEETWLDEGLAHVAEELVFYARAGLSPMADLDAAKLRSSTTYRAAFNDEGISNFDRLETFLAAPATHSPYADDDSLETRGATWSFLRWAVDHQASSSQESVWYQIVNSNETGLANLRGVFGSDLPSMFRDWATSLLLDDVSGAGARYQEPSWNLRSMLDALSSSGTYPLQTTTLASGATKNVSVTAGGAAYVRFGVAAGSTGAVSWTAPAATSVTLVRLK